MQRNFWNSGKALRPRSPMGFLDALNHALNFFLPAIGMALLVPSLARLVWWKALKSAGWLRQVKWAALINAAVLIVGL